ncbi:hypothetical protein ACOMHN_065436 [Nucella lapillus]
MYTPSDDTDFTFHHTFHHKRCQILNYVRHPACQAGLHKSPKRPARVSGPTHRPRRIGEVEEGWWQPFESSKLPQGLYRATSTCKRDLDGRRQLCTAAAHVTTTVARFKPPPPPSPRP